MLFVRILLPSDGSNTFLNKYYIDFDTTFNPNHQIVLRHFVIKLKQFYLFLPILSELLLVVWKPMNYTSVVMFTWDSYLIRKKIAKFVFLYPFWILIVHTICEEYVCYGWLQLVFIAQIVIKVCILFFFSLFLLIVSFIDQPINMLRSFAILNHNPSSL